MVLKVGKRGVRSGNTLKASMSRHLRQYSKQSCLTQQCIRNEEDSKREFADVLGRDAENVPFSLNKKGCWKLPNELKEQIMNGYFNEEDFGVQLIERHNIVRQNNGVSFCSSKTPVNRYSVSRPKQTVKRNGYLYIKSLLNTNMSSRVRNRNGRYVSVPKPDICKPSQIRYEVVYPCSISSSIIHNPKYIGYVPGEGRRSRGKRHRQKFKHTIEESLLYIAENNSDGSEDEDAGEYTDGEEKRAPTEKEVILKDLLSHTSKAHELFHRESLIESKPTPTDGIDRDNNTPAPEKNQSVHTVNELEADSKAKLILKSETVNTTNDIVTNPILMVLSNNEIDPYDLEQIYGRQYIECGYFPRKFIIEISTDVSNLDCYNYIEDKKAKDIIACLVFTHDVENEINNARESVYKVTINMKLKPCTTAVNIETLFDYTESNISEIIERTLFFIETLPADVLIKERKYENVSAFAVESARGECTDWKKCKSYLPTETYLYQTFLFRSANIKETDVFEFGKQAEALRFEVVSSMDSYTPDTADITSPSNRFCYVCYEEIGGTVSATALMSCGHWFCDGYWREHLITCINSGTTKLICPEYDCSRTIDSGTLLSLINIQHVLKHSQLCHDTKVEQQMVTNWCPAPNCGRVVEVSSSHVKIAQCACKQKFCFQCLSNDHWPAPCEIVPQYKKTLYESGDESVLPADFIKPLSIYGKNCPHCNKFIEKDGGCNQMSCICGGWFCWGCGKEWDKDGGCNQMSCICGGWFCWGCGKEWDKDIHTIYCASYRTGYNNKHETHIKSFSIDEQEHTYRHQQWYSLAVSYRMQQHPKKVRKLKSVIPELSRTIITYVHRSTMPGEPAVFDFEVPGIKFKNIAGKVKVFLNDMVELYSKVNHIAEHIGVLLNSDMVDEDTHMPLKVIAARLGAFGKFIYEVFTSGTAHNPKISIAKADRNISPC